MRELKKTLSILLSIVMIFSVFTVIFVSAADTQAEPEFVPVSITGLASSGAQHEADPIRAKPAHLATVGAISDIAATGYYDIVVGRTIVSDSNKDDILGDGGKVRYDPATKTLSFDDPTISEAYDTDYGIIQIQTDGVTLTGSFNMTGSKSYYGLCVTDDYDVTVSGDFTFYGNDCGIAVNETVTVGGGTVKAFGTGAGSIGISARTLAVSDSITRLEMQGVDEAYFGEHFTFNNTRITYPADAFFSEVTGGVILADYSGIASRAVIEPFSGTSYDLWLGSRRVTSENCSDIFGDGKASFVPSTGVLTLDSPSIVGAHPVTVDTLQNLIKIYSNIPLTVKGSYGITESELNFLHPDDGSEDTDDLLGGLYSTENITLDGDFTFTATAYPLFSEKDITVDSGTVTVYGGASVGIGAPKGTLTIKNEIAKIDAESSSYPLYAKVITCGKNLMITTPEKGALKYYEGSEIYVVCDEDENDATHVVIEPFVMPPTEPPLESYNVALGDTAVTNRNKDDILEDGGKAKYDPVTKTLTLNEPTINGVFTSGDSTFKIASVDDITIKGKYTMTSAEAVHGVYSEHSVTFDGDFTVMGTKFGVRAKEGVTVDGGSLKVVSTGSYGIYSDGGAFTVTNDATRVEVQCGYAAILSPSIDFGSYVTIVSPAKWRDVEVSNTGDEFHTVVDEDNELITALIIEKGDSPVPTELPTEPEPIVHYDLWIGSGQVTSYNKDDILGDGGKAKYDPVTKTLTLNDPTVEGVVTSSNSTFKISCLDDLTLKGSYNMASAEAKNGIYVEGSLTLDGSFTFMGTSVGVRAKDGITVNSGTLKAVSSGNYGIYNETGSFTVTNGAVRAESHGSLAAILSPTIELGDNMDITTPATWRDVTASSGDTEYHTIVDGDDQLAKDVVIERKRALLGDADGDGEVTSVDATVMQRAIAFMKVPDSYDEAAADVDGDGEVTSVDVTYVQRWLAYMAIPYPVGE